jgi:hypothetical protein
MRPANKSTLGISAKAGNSRAVVEPRRKHRGPFYSVRRTTEHALTFEAQSRNEQPDRKSLRSPVADDLAATRRRLASSGAATSRLLCGPIDRRETRREFIQKEGRVCGGGAGNSSVDSRDAPVLGVVKEATIVPSSSRF